ncbi:hypothetical protein ACWT_7312 [Actinoplanes sp. SE50]|uniref:DUF2550 domain-containing protein n=1 Tax=unclassified Actinoplanes TaxID=2626549 RepID=UPI00023EDF9C|nr:MULTISPECIES: DUF2550 domain-containing protein [unclassified Actinoplanes]AEV88322.1 uncharacterized protein ACPL_7442 [Actinoplanes sp. SE50/110]ATO86727.1 hypothetical protein ACWT_7312 [Actinoplanes sp. SE50]SLM04145.1 uncharacterized protein ACSP50_7447 [Actinoplanes sp. SE50/110]
MRVLEVFGICLVALLALLFAIFFRRRLLMLGGGTIRLQVRTSTMVPGRGWSPGLGQFVGDELRFHKMFSLAFRPKRVLDRRTLAIAERRLPTGPERLTMPGHWVVLRCATAGVDLEIAMAETTVTGFLSWLEAGPPRDPGSVPGRSIFGPRSLES